MTLFYLRQNSTNFYKNCSLGIDDDDITDVSFPKGIPFVYKFDKNLNTVKPDDDSLTQIHTNGSFLEKPDLLDKALKSQKLWEQRVPGSSGDDLPSVAKRATTMENALLRLREEKETWVVSKDESEKESTEPVVFTNGDNVATIDNASDETDDESFEEKTSSSTIDKEEITVNWSGIENVNDPIVVFVRHGRTPHNKLQLFTGWEDPPLAIEGVEDARNAGRMLKKHGFQFDVVYTSWLYRAIQTAWYITEEMDLLWLPLITSWRLNERH